MIKNNLRSFNSLKNKFYEQEKQFKRELAKTFLEYLDCLPPNKRIEQMELLLNESTHRVPTLGRRLTPQENKCLYLASKGKEIKEMAKILGLSQRTIKFHRANITKKLEVPNFMEAVTTTINNKLKFDTSCNCQTFSRSFLVKNSGDVYGADKKNLYLGNEDNSFISLFDFLDLNYSVIDINRNYIFQNNSAINNITRGLLRAKDIDPSSWLNCRKVMNCNERRLIEETFEGKLFLSIKQPLFDEVSCLGILVISLDVTNLNQYKIESKNF